MNRSNYNLKSRSHKEMTDHVEIPCDERHQDVYFHDDLDDWLDFLEAQNCIDEDIDDQDWLTDDDFHDQDGNPDFQDWHDEDFYF